MIKKQHPNKKKTPKTPQKTKNKKTKNKTIKLNFKTNSATLKN